MFFFPSHHCLLYTSFILSLMTSFLIFSRLETLAERLQKPVSAVTNFFLCFVQFSSAHNLLAFLSYCKSTPVDIMINCRYTNCSYFPSYDEHWFQYNVNTTWRLNILHFAFCCIWTLYSISRTINTYLLKDRY